MSKKAEKKAESTAPKNDLPLSKENYLLMIGGFVVIIIGFALMTGGNTDIYSFRKITLAPIVILAGFLFEIYAIMKKPKDTTPDAE
jgi:hypothetical protein